MQSPPSGTSRKADSAFFTTAARTRTKVTLRWQEFCSSGTILRRSPANTESVSLSAQWKEKFLAKIDVWPADSSEEKQKYIDRLNADLSALKAKLERINTAFADGSLDIDEFKEPKNPLVSKKVGLEEKILA